MLKPCGETAAQKVLIWEFCLMWFVSPEERAKLTPHPHEPDADARVAWGEPDCPCEVAGAPGTGGR